MKNVEDWISFDKDGGMYVKVIIPDAKDYDEFTKHLSDNGYHFDKDEYNHSVYISEEEIAYAETVLADHELKYEINQDAINYVNMSLSFKDAAYRLERTRYTIEDLVGLATERDLVLPDGAFDEMAKKYAFDGEYDCNLSYWDNLNSLIDDWMRINSDLGRSGET